MRPRQLLALLTCLSLALTGAVNAQAPHPLADFVFVGPPDTVSYRSLLRSLRRARGFDRADALRRMQWSYPDSARAWAVRHLRGVESVAAGATADAIVGDSGEHTAVLLGLLPSLPDRVLQRIFRPLAFGVEMSGRSEDSLQRVLLRSDRAAMRELAMDLFTAELDLTSVSPDERRLLAQGAGDRDRQVRAAALEAVGWRVPPSDTVGLAWAIGLIESGMKDPETPVRAAALHVVAWRGLSVPAAVPLMRHAARHGEPRWERRSAVTALGAQKEAALVAVPDLLEYLRHRDAQFAEEALAALTNLARSGVVLPAEVPPAVQRFRGRLENPYAQLGVVRALAALRDTNALVDLTRDPQPIVAAGALQALTAVAPTHPAVGEALDDPRPEVADAAILGVVPILFDDPTALHPRTDRGRALRDSALTVTRSLGASRLVGKCFSVAWSRFLPEMALGMDSVYVTPPRTIAFLASPSGFPSRDGYRASIGVANGAEWTVHAIGLWQWDATVDSLSAAWTTGFSGVSMQAGWDGEMLRGTLSTFWDFPRPSQDAEVRLTPVACTSIRRDRGE